MLLGSFSKILLEITLLPLFLFTLQKFRKIQAFQDSGKTSANEVFKTFQKRIPLLILSSITVLYNIILRL